MSQPTDYSIPDLKNYLLTKLEGKVILSHHNGPDSFGLSLFKPIVAKDDNGDPVIITTIFIAYTTYPIGKIGILLYAGDEVIFCPAIDYVYGRAFDSAYDVECEIHRICQYGREIDQQYGMELHAKLCHAIALHDTALHSTALHATALYPIAPCLYGEQPFVYRVVTLM